MRLNVKVLPMKKFSRFIHVQRQTYHWYVSHLDSFAFQRVKRPFYLNHLILTNELTGHELTSAMNEPGNHIYRMKLCPCLDLPHQHEEGQRQYPFASHHSLHHYNYVIAHQHNHATHQMLLEGMKSQNSSHFQNADA